jgi:hypothetical protein
VLRDVENAFCCALLVLVLCVVCIGLGPIPETPMQHSAFYPCPTLISSLAEANQVVVSVACGASHTLFLTDLVRILTPCKAEISSRPTC